jgi:hypothetical protein
VALSSRGDRALKYTCAGDAKLTTQAIVRGVAVCCKLCGCADQLLVDGRLGHGHLAAAQRSEADGSYSHAVPSKVECLNTCTGCIECARTRLTRTQLCNRRGRQLLREGEYTSVAHAALPCSDCTLRACKATQIACG